MMLHLKLVLQSFFKNKQIYGPFIFSASILTALNYIFWSIFKNPSLAKLQQGATITTTASLGISFVALIGLFFMFYINNTQKTIEAKQLGLYNMLGFAKGDLYLFQFLKNCCLLLATVAIGLSIGILFSKFFFLIFQRIIGLDGLSSTIELDVLGINVAYVAGIYLLLLLKDLFYVWRVNPIELWHGAQKPEKEPKQNILLGLLGIVILSGGYYLAITTKPNMAGINKFMLAILLVVLGTYLVFISFSIVLLKFLKRRPNYYYNPKHFISLSGMLYRMKQNGAGLASICLLCSSVCVVMISTISLYAGQQKALATWNPTEIVLNLPQDLTPAQKTTLNDLAKKSQVKITDETALTLAQPLIGKFQGNRFVEENFSTAIYKLAGLTLAQYNKMQQTNYQLKENEALIYAPNEKLGQQLTVASHKLKIKQIKDFKLAINYDHSIFQPVFLVVKNQQQLDKIFSKHHQKDSILPNSNNDYVYLKLFNLAGSLPNQKSFVQAVVQNFKLVSAQYSFKAEMRDFFKQFTGGFLFVGFLVSVALGLTTVIIIYYKQLSEGYADRQRFQTMQQVGLSRKETKKTIIGQVLAVFLLPLLGSGLNTACALPAIISVMKIFSLYDQKLFITVSLIVFGCLSLLYLGVYLLTTQVYQKIVNQKD